MRQVRLLLVFALFTTASHADNWSTYGSDAGGSKFSPLTQIHPKNLESLKQAWVYRSGETGDGYADGHNLTFQATPIYWEGLLFFNSSFGKIYAVDAETGEERWRHDAKFDPNARYSETAARGVSVWHNSSPGDRTCDHRIVAGNLRGELWALDALTGNPCSDFGVDGRLDLTQGVGDVDSGDYTITSPPAIIGNTLFIGSAIGDNRKIESERGIVRAIDVLTGDIRWSWDPIPRSPADPAFGTWSGNSAGISGGGNAWAPLSVDAQLNLVYVPTSAASPDFSGGHRAGDNLYTNSLVALDASTGELRWHFQFVHHDVWDYDTPAQPTLTTITRDDVSTPAVVQVTKTGMMYVLDRRTGKPIVGVEERAVPGAGVPGEQLASTQPFSMLPPLARHVGLTEDDAFGILFFDKRSCAKRIRKYRSDGIFTPPTIQGSILTPGYAGGANWGGVAVDEARGIAVSFINELPAVVRLVPREDFTPETRPEPDMGWSWMHGTPYVLQRDPFLSFLGLPCTQPPWGRLVAMDLNNERIAWERPLGTIADLAPAIVPNFAWGIPGMGGPLITASGLVFIGAVAENKFRAIDVENGATLWESSLPLPGVASPMTYTVNGRQFVVIAAGGHGQLTDEQGDFLVAFALD